MSDTCNPTAVQSTRPRARSGARRDARRLDDAEDPPRGHLNAGVSADTLLFGFRNPYTGQLEGFDIDMVHRIAQTIFGDPNKVAFKVMTYSGRIPALQRQSTSSPT